MMETNFKLTGGFGIPEKEKNQRKKTVQDIIDRYYEKGIREFFLGYNPTYWHEKFGFEFSPNMRFSENEQVTSYETFKEAVDYVHSLKKENGESCDINMTVNFRYYTDITMPYIKQIIDEGVKAGIDGIIVAGPEILEYLAEIGFKGKINISTILTLYNEDAIQFFIEYFQEKGLNLKRIVLPRELTLKEIETITNKFPEIDFEVFGQGDYCRYANGLCMAEHKYFSRDICGFMLKHGLNIKKTIKHNFKDIILDKEKDDIQKQEELDNQLKELDYIFVAQNVSENNQYENLLTYYIDQFENEFYGEKSKEEIIEISKKIQKLAKIDVLTNFHKYIYDGLMDDKDLHNKYINDFLTIIKLINNYIELDEKLSNKINEIKNLRKNIKKRYHEVFKEKGKFGLKGYYKFMILNRTSTPLFKFFNNIKNIDIIKIPLRGRDLSMAKLGIDEVQEGVKNPEKFIDETNINGKYFHYDPTYLDIYQEKIKKLSEN